jgi:hypothetical protein
MRSTRNLCASALRASAALSLTGPLHAEEDNTLSVFGAEAGWGALRLGAGIAL